MSTEQQLQSPWELKVQAKASDFDFRLSAAIKNLPLARNLSRFSIRLKLSRVFIKLKCKPKASSSKNLKFFKSKFCKILERFRIRHGTRKAIPAIANEGSACGNLALLWQWISGNNEKGILVLSRIIFPYLASAFKNLVGRKMTIFSTLMVLIVSSSILLLYLLYHYYEIYSS